MVTGINYSIYQHALGIGGDKYLDGVRIIFNLAKVNTILCMCTALSQGQRGDDWLHSMHRKD